MPNTKKGKNRSWDNLNTDQERAARALGFNRNSWNEGTNTETMTLKDLNNAIANNEKNLREMVGNAARILGYERREEFPVLLSRARNFLKKKNLKTKANNGNNNSQKSKNTSTNVNNVNKPKKPNDNNSEQFQNINGPYYTNNMEGGKKSTSKKPKKIRKHKGIYQTGPKKGKLKPGYKYSGQKTKTGLKIIVKTKK